MAGSGGGYGQSRASGGTFDPASVPFDGPFTAFIGNLSYDVTEHELETFFGSEIRVGNGVAIYVESLHSFHHSSLVC